MVNTQTVIVNNEEFEVTVSGSAWQTCETLSAVDGTIEIKARSVQKPKKKITGLIHGNLARELPHAPFIVTISLQQISKILADALAEWTPNRFSLDHKIIHCSDHYRICNDARWGIKNCAVTRAPRYAGKAQATLDAEFDLMSNSGMQDWPLEVSDPEFSLPDPEFVFRISGQLRQIWDRSLVPIEIYWNYAKLSSEENQP